MTIVLPTISDVLDHPLIHAQWQYAILHSVWLIGCIGNHTHHVPIGRSFDRILTFVTLGWDPVECRTIVLEAVEAREYCWIWIGPQIFFIEEMDAETGVVALGPEIVLRK